MDWTTASASGLRNVHTRQIDAPAARVWDLVSALGTDADRVWPSDRWPALVLSDGVRPGSDGGHGPIRYGVEAVDAGQRVRFSFNPSAGLTGWHEFRVAPAGSGSVVTHTLQVEKPTALISKVVIPLHDALLEDLMDQLESVVADRPVTRRPLSPGIRARVAALSMLEAPPAPSVATRSPRMIAAGAATATLAALGVLHVAWGRGSHWPASSAESLAQHVLGTSRPDDLPGPLACHAVGAALGVAAASCLATQSYNDTARAAGAVTVAGASTVLGLRGLIGLVTSGVRRTRTLEYRRLDLAVYSPLCLAVSATMHWLRRAP